MGDSRNSTPRRIETPDPIVTKFDTVDYVRETSTVPNFMQIGSRGASRQMREITKIFLIYIHRVSKKLCKLIFRHNFAKFRGIVKIFGTKIAERTGFFEVYSFSTSPNLCQHTIRVKRRCSKLLHNAVIISLQ